MFLPNRLRLFLLSTTALLVTTQYSDAGYFRRYPGEEETQQAAPAPASDAMSDEEFLEEEAEEPAGLLGDRFHGSGGLIVEYIYTGEVFTNMRGGTNTRKATEYQGIFDLVMTADLCEMGFAPGGTFFLYGQNHHGRNLTDHHVGDAQALSNIAARDYMQISEYWWERGVIDEFLTVRLGKQDSNAEFGVTDLSGDFINSSFGFAPTIPMATFPDPSMAVVTFFELTDWLAFNVGIFDGAGYGGNWGFSNTGDILSLYELKATYDLCDLPGDFMVGMWHHNGACDDPNEVDSYINSHGVYLGMDQLLWKEHCCDPDDDQGLGTFLQYGWAPEERSDIHQYFGAGLVYKGFIRCRDDDIMGLGIARAEFSSAPAIRKVAMSRVPGLAAPLSDSTPIAISLRMRRCRLPPRRRP